jgi:hypothetical protein
MRSRRRDAQTVDLLFGLAALEKLEADRKQRKQRHQPIVEGIGSESLTQAPKPIVEGIGSESLTQAPTFLRQRISIQLVNG